MTVIAPRSKEEIQEIIRSIEVTSREIFKDKKSTLAFFRKVDPNFGKHPELSAKSRRRTTSGK